MLKVLLHFARGLHGVRAELARIAAALERIAPAQALTILPVSLIQTDEASLDYEARRCAAWEAVHGPLRPGETPPDDFSIDDEEKESILRKFFDS